MYAYARALATLVQARLHKSGTAALALGGVFWVFFFTPWHNLLILPSSKGTATTSTSTGVRSLAGFDHPLLLRVYLVKTQERFQSDSGF